MCKQIFSYYFFVSCSRSTALPLCLLRFRQSIHNSHRCAWISEGFCSIIGLCQPWKLESLGYSNKPPAEPEYELAASRCGERGRVISISANVQYANHQVQVSVQRPKYPEDDFPHTATRGKLDGEVAEEYEIPQNSLQCLYFF